MTGGGKFTLISYLEYVAGELGKFSIRSKAWARDAVKLEEEGLKVTLIGPTTRKGENYYLFDWSTASIDIKNYSPSDPHLSRANRLWVMAYLANHPTEPIRKVS